MRIRERAYRHGEIGDFSWQETLKGEFAVYSPQSKLPVRVFKTLRAAKAWCLRSQKALSHEPER